VTAVPERSLPNGAANIFLGVAHGSEMISAR
jgi:hypothetical protein